MADIMEALETSEWMICKGISEINAKGELNASNLELLGESVDALKDIYEIREKMHGGSYERDWYGRRDYRTSYGHSMDDEREFLKWKMQNATNDHERDMYRRRMEQI